MTARERISYAQTSSDLGDVPVDEIGDIDVIRACGMAGQDNPIGLALWRFKYADDRREVFYLASQLIVMGYDRRLVVKVLKHIANDRCDDCEGRGYQVIPDTPILSDEVCPACQGSGRKTIEGEAERDLVEYLASLERMVAGNIMKKLATDMEL